MAKTEKLSLDELLEQALVKDENKPYEVPNNWVWTRLKPISLPMVTTKPDKNLSHFRYIDIDAIDNKTQSIREYKTIETLQAPSRASRGLSEGNTLFSLVRPYLKNIAYVHKEYADCIASTGFFVFKPSNIANARYMFYLLCSEYVITNVTFMMKGDNSPSIRGSELEEFPIPLPPLSEQQRIVNLIESLFEKLDRAKELVQNTLDSFENRKSAILHKAFNGELSAKWRGENVLTTSEKYFEIIKEQRLEISDTRKRKEIDDSFNSFDIQANTMPNGWIRLKAMMVCDIITCGNTPSDKINAIGDIPFLKVYNIVNNKIDFNYRPQFIDSETHNGKLKTSKLLPNDIAMNIVGPPLRKIAIIPNDYPEWNMNQAIVRFRTIGYIDYKFFYYCLLNDETLDELISETKGVVGQANISITQSRNLLIPIPSLEEQKEIVRLLDNLLDNEQKAKGLYDVIETIDLIKKSILARAFRGELSTNNPNEESAMELLKEILSERG